MSTERETKHKLNSLITTKKILFGYNYIIWAAGCVAACIGIWFRVNRNFVTLTQRIEEADIELKSTGIYLGANLLISIGSIIAFVGLLGSLSTTKENEYFLSLVSLNQFFQYKILLFLNYLFILVCNFNVYCFRSVCNGHNLGFHSP